MMYKKEDDFNCSSCIYRSYLFDMLSQEELEIISANKAERTFAPGELIVREGDLIKDFLYLKKGLIKIHKYGRDQKDHIISLAIERDFAGLLSSFAYRYHHYSLSSLDYSEMCIIDFNVIKEVMATNTKFTFNIIEKISLAANNVILYRYNLGKLNLRGRISSVLLDFSDKIFKSDCYNLPVTRKEIGELIDMSTENVIRIISEFRKDGIIDVSGREIIIRDKGILKNIAEKG